MYDYIAIERRYACGGHFIATSLAERLNYRLYDTNVLLEACKELNLPYSMAMGMDEQAPVKTFFTLPGDKFVPMEDQIFQAESRIIKEAAEKPGAIFVGRCASESLKDKKCLRVFITASFDFRLGRAINVEKLPQEHAQTEMKKFDTRREKFYAAHSQSRWGTPENFDLVLNSERLGIDACVNILEQACKGN